MNAHVGEAAELYALGALDDRERAQVEAHAAQCDACATALGSAESTVAALITERAPSAPLDRRMRSAFMPRPAWQTWSPLAAAAIVLAIVLPLWFTRPASPPSNADAIVAMTNSHFTHSQFGALAASAPKAKVIYARTGAWWYVIAQTNRAYTVAVVENGKLRRIGTLHANGNAAQLYVAHPPPARMVLLLDGGTPVARATLQYRR